jgi:hypothetical protein
VHDNATQVQVSQLSSYNSRHKTQSEIFMADTELLREAFGSGNYQYTDHGLKRAIERSIPIAEIRDALKDFEVIEDYPDDKYGHSCLLYAMMSDGRPLHIQVSYSKLPAKIITVYEPDPQEWENYRIRKNP